GWRIIRRAGLVLAIGWRAALLPPWNPSALHRHLDRRSARHARLLVGGGACRGSLVDGAREGAHGRLIDAGDHVGRDGDWTTRALRARHVGIFDVALPIDAAVYLRTLNVH